MPPLALVGNLSRDLVDGGPPRIGGGAYHGARALRALGRSATVLARCGEHERSVFLRELAVVGVPVTVLRGTTTTAFSFRYESDRRVMRVDAVGDGWVAGDVARVPARASVHVAPLLRSDFSADTLAALARDGRRVSLDGQGLVRVPEVGPLRLDAAYDPAVLEHVTILKLAEEEAEIVGAVDRLGVPEVVVTFGSRGSRVYAGGRSEDVAAWPVARDPTGSGDAFAVAYLAGRVSGHAPGAAARRATALVGALLADSAR